MGRLRLTALVVVVAAALAVPLVALAQKRVASANGVTATLTYSGSFPYYTHERLTISVGGSRLYDQPVRSSLCAAPCGPFAAGPGNSAVRVLNLESGVQPDVVLGLYSGGAHCCITDQVFSLDPGTMTYVRSEHDFYDAGATIRRLGGHYEFVSADIRPFAYAFTDFADSGAPIQIWDFNAGKFRDVTRHFPAQINADAAQWFKAFKHTLNNGEGFIAAWAADEDMLGNSKLVSSTLANQLRQGHLRSLSGPTGKKFVSALQKLLRQLGYAG